MEKVVKDSELKETQKIPIYSSALKLMKCSDRIMMSMDRDHKHTFGQNILNWNLELLGLISKAYHKTNNKLERVQDVVDKANDIANLMKYCSDVKYIDHKLYAESLEHISSVLRQANGWLNATLQEETD